MKVKACLLGVLMLVAGLLLVPGAAAQESPSPSPTEEASPSPDTSESPKPKPSPSNNNKNKDKDKDKGGGKGGDKGRNPKGNNGTIKIEDAAIDDIPQNNPHPGCVFQIEFYNYDEGDLNAVASFTNQPPSGDGLIFERDEIFIGEDEATGGRDLDARITVDLADALAASGAEPHPKQGFHIKLTVHAEGSIGADVKHKVFWIEECEDEVLAARAAAAVLAARAAAEAAARAAANDVAAAGVGRGAPGSQLPFTGPRDVLALYAALGFGFIVLGLLFSKRQLVPEESGSSNQNSRSVQQPLRKQMVGGTGIEPVTSAV